eukprot:GHVT01087999.1.p1 GENE.GHVT01087999.1~~GHVT01087999.1.p1  ORF type:complete len:123 (+),score=21.59 GHVT01087999.1:2848-3216(+)
MNVERRPTAGIRRGDPPPNPRKAVGEILVAKTNCSCQQQISKHCSFNMLPDRQRHLSQSDVGGWGGRRRAVGLPMGRPSADHSQAAGQQQDQGSSDLARRMTCRLLRFSQSHRSATCRRRSV